MIDQSDGPKTISVTEFKAHCTEELRAVEEKGTRLMITRHGKTIAVVEPPHDESGRTLGEMMGTACGMLTIQDDAGLEEPAWQDDAWEMHRDESGS